MKILSPVGNFDCLKVAVANGADEVYLGINDFNARNNIDGFTLDTLKDAVDYAHVFGVKVLLAINILFTDDELQSAVNTVVDAYNLGVDAFIIQDLGLADILGRNYPQVELHASTQMGLHNLEGVQEVEKYGFKRIVLARETPLEEIRRIKENCDLELEYFVHGALCVSFSGNCYISSYLHGASGNRGRCKQLCRLPYTLEYNGVAIKKGHLLSAKDFNMSNRLLDLKKAGVDVLKIEGRARRPYYVATATKQYHNALNGLKVDDDEVCLAFNRGFTEGYFNGNGDMLSNTHNHSGIKVGKVLSFNNGENFNEVVITSNRELTPKSTLKFYNSNAERNTLTAYDIKLQGCGKYRITTTQTLFVGDDVHLIADAEKEKNTLATNKKRKINISLFLKDNYPIKAVINEFDEIIAVSGEVCQTAKTRPITKQEIIDNFNKHEFFMGDITFEEFDNVFLPKQKLNEFRRSLYQKVYEKLTQTTRESLAKIKVENLSYVKAEDLSFKDFVYTDSKSFNVQEGNVIYSPEHYDLNDVQEFMKICKEKGKVPFLDTPNFALKEDVELIKDIVKKTGINVVANNYYATNLDAQMVIGAGLNVYNKHTAKAWNKPVISAENSSFSMINAPFMTLRHCPIKAHVGGNCGECRYKDGYVYRLENGKQLYLKRKKLTTCTFYLV